MNDQFDELDKHLTESVARLHREAPGYASRTVAGVSGSGLKSALLGLALAAVVACSARANDFRLGPIIDLSDPDPFRSCPGGFPLALDDAEAEPTMAVNPTNPKNVIAVWIGGKAKGIVAGVTFDGGKKWQQVPIPGLNQCSGGPLQGAVDEWVSFAPNGDLYLSSLAIVDPSCCNAVTVSKSADGGLHWTNPVILDANTDTRFQADKPSITADPTDSRLVYAAWERRANGNRGPVMLSRSTDRGRTWEPARVLFDAGTSGEIIDTTIIVLPDGTLLAVFNEIMFSNANGGSQKNGVLSVIRSVDKGAIWSSVTRGAAIPASVVTDPETGEGVATGGSYPPFFSVAADPRNGNLYVVWEDAGFSGGLYSSIAFSMSSDAGLTWSAPIQVNKTPDKIAPGNRQAFLPTIAVAADGTIGVTYYDFRNNSPAPGLPTDYWMVHCHASSTISPATPNNWGNETRLTDVSFDLETAPNPFGFFLGDYMGLATAGNDFLALFCQSFESDPSSVFFRRVGP